MKTVILSFLCFIFLNSNAQKLLEIDVYQSDITNNGYFLDNQIQEYGALNISALYLVVIDTLTCTPWYTILDSWSDNINGHSLFNWNQLGAGRARQEAYFIYYQNDSTHLNGLNSAINDSIGEGQLFFIYAPIEYNFTQIEALSPALASTLITYGGVSAGQNHAISLLLAKKGIPESYHYEFNDNLNSEIHYSDTICKNDVLSINQLNKGDFKMKQIDEKTYQLSGTDISNLEIINLLGQNIDFNILNSEENSVVFQIKSTSNEVLILKTDHFSSIFFKN